MKKYFVVLVIVSLILISCNKKNQVEEQKKVLTIYSYDSFVTYGLGKQAIPEFETMYQCSVQVITAGDAGAMLNRLVMEKNNPKADIAVGIDNTFLQKALEQNMFEPYTAAGLDKLDQRLIFDTTHCFTPFDYGYFAFVYDSEKVKNPPKSFQDLLKPEWKKKIILIDPRTSSPGKGLLIWSYGVYGKDKFAGFWEKLKGNVLTTPASWDEAYNMFLTGEAPIVLSYATSPAYHFENEKTEKYKAFIPSEGGFRQIEGAGILKGTKNQELAQKFLDFMLTEKFQKYVPLTQWMYPVLETVPLPKGFDLCPKTDKDLSNVINTPDFNSEELIENWITIMTK